MVQEHVAAGLTLCLDCILSAHSRSVYGALMYTDEVYAISSSVHTHSTDEETDHKS